MLSQAIHKATKLDYRPGQKRLWAIAVDKKGKVIAESSNSYIKTHPLQAKFAKLVGLEDKCYLHAEIATIIKAKGQQVSKLYVARVDSKGNPCLAAPCPVCNAALKKYGISSVEYTL